MRQLKALLLAALALVFVAGVGTGAWIGSLAAEPPGTGVDRRVRDFDRVYHLTPTQVRQLREILYDNDRRKDEIRRRTQLQEIQAIEAESRGRIRQILNEDQLREYDRRVGAR